jgi:hypothetical protein
MNIDEETAEGEGEEGEKEDEIADVAIHPISARPPEQRIDEELRCVQCGAPVPNVACGRVTPCRSCGYLYPLGDCSDLAEN